MPDLGWTEVGTHVGTLLAGLFSGLRFKKPAEPVGFKSDWIKRVNRHMKTQHKLVGKVNSIAIDHGVTKKNVADLAAGLKGASERLDDIKDGVGKIRETLAALTGERPS